MTALGRRVREAASALASMQSVRPAGAGASTEPMIDPIELSYELRLLPRGRIAFHRWRYELWHGPQLLAAGWRLSALHAQRAVGAHAIRYAHRVHGLHPLRPEHPGPSDPEAPWSGRRVALESGDLRVMLTPRGLAEAAA